MCSRKENEELSWQLKEEEKSKDMFRSSKVGEEKQQSQDMYARVERTHFT